ncbi:iron-containing alcohol dehydrogenase [Streptomyces cinnamoneus]|uniref:iron-containing alcohol dehydrogenase n=1 Tax=Streptomyces cinnamoneus TaxID=53446 RepID=UPI00341B628F
MRLELPVPTRVVFGRGTLDRVGAATAPWGGHALIVCGRTAMRRHGFLDRAEASLRAAGLRVTVFDRISANPRSDEVDEAVALARARSCDVVVGLGGGSAIDAAKAVAVAGPYDTVRDIIGETLAASPSALPVVAVPTTAGSGSEVTKGAIVTDVVRGFRSGIRGDDVFPKVAVVDPDLTAPLPVAVAVETAFDALAHVIEGYVAARATEESRAHARRAIVLIRDHLPLVAAGDTGHGTREAMALAALLGGVNVACASTCLPHRLQQAMGAVRRTEIPHGRGLALLYPAWLRAAHPHATEGFADIADALGHTDVHRAIAAVLDRAGLASGLTDWGFTAQDIDAFVDGISGNLDNDPTPAVDTDLIRHIYTDSLGPGG